MSKPETSATVEGEIEEGVEVENEDMVMAWDEDEQDDLELEGAKNPPEILQRFVSRFRSRSSDIFADFGANALFMIDGEALLGHCFENHLVDWQYGGEPLHVLYLFLFYLQQLTQRDARFRLAFFENCEPLWSESKRLTRFLVINHLKEFTKYDVDVLSSISGKDFENYLVQYFPTNVMTKLLWEGHNGEEEEATLQSISRTLCMQSLVGGRSVFLLEEGITFRGPRVHMFVMFYRSKSNKALKFLEEALTFLPSATSPAPSDELKATYDKALVSSTDKLGKEVGQRLAVGWACIEEGVKRGVAGLKGEVGVFLGKVFFLHLVMLHFRGPLKRGFLLPEERPKNVVFDGGMQLLNDLYPIMLEFSKVSMPEKAAGKVVNTESDLWDGRAFFALILALFKLGGGKEVGVEKVLGVLGLKNADDLTSLISSFDKSGALGAPIFPLSLPAAAKGDFEALEKIFDSLVKKNEEITKNNEEKAKFTLSWTETPEILSDCVPEVCDILDKKDHKYIPPDEKPAADSWEVGNTIQDPDHYSYSIGVKVSATVSEEAYKALVGLSVALSKARDIGNDEVARIAREAAVTMFQINRSISDEMVSCANKRNWLDLQKIVAKQIKQLDPKRLNQKQGDFFSKYAESLIGGPICRQSIRETEPEPKSTKKDEKAPKPHQVKGKAKVVLAKKHLQQLDRCLATLQDIDGKKLGVAYDKVDYIVKQGASNTGNSANVRLSWDSFNQSFKEIKELRGKASQTMESVAEVRDLSAKQKGPMQQKTTTLQKIDSLHIEDKLIGLQWHIRIQRLQNVSIPWWETFVKKRKGANGTKNEEWAAAVVLDQLMEDVMAVKAYLATNPPAPAEFEASGAASSGKGKNARTARLNKSTREFKNSDSAPLASACVQAAMRFGFEDLAKQIGKDLKYKISSKDKQYPDVSRTGSFVEFQLRCMGPRLPRPVGKPDERTTGFNPDDWQRDLLDIVDRKESALISAPTSSGKTFISFYAMEQVLREPAHGSDLPVIVYVSPTKALVNQVQAEIAARFVKNYQFPGQTICGVFTKDFRYNVESCQILVTVPDCLDVMLLSPQYASWMKRIRWVIFDEVHMISKEGGEVWERLILYLDCPFLALSATVGNPTEFEEWLRKVGEDKARTRLPGKGKEVAEGGNTSQFHLIKHEQRWNDLEVGWVKANSEGSAASSYEVLPINPLGTLDLHSTRRDGFPSIKLLPEQSLDVSKKLASLMEGHGGELEERAASLVPNTYFSLKEDLRLRLNKVVEYEKTLLKLTNDVIMEAPEVGNALVDFYAKQNGFASLDNSDVASLSARSLLDFLKTLQNKEEDEMDGLPVIVFNLDDNNCKNMANQIEEFLGCEQFTYELFEFIKKNKGASDAAQAGTLSTAEMCKDVLENEQAYCQFIRRYPMIARGSIPDTFEDKPEADQRKKMVLEALHKAKLRYYDKQITLAAKLSKVNQKKKQKADNNKPDEGDIPDDEDEISPEQSVEQYQPGYINPKFSFCGRDGAVTDAILREHSLMRMPENLLRCLRRGIGIHFMDLPIKYKNAVERLFRSRHLSVIIATETLSLGINMPCRTVLFHGDHAKLDAQMFRQMSGRAGRRNFDLRGKVLFYGTPKPKIKMMLNSRLGELTGNVPLTPSLTLRLFHRHFQTKGKNKEICHETASAISRVLHLPFNVIRKGAGDFTIPVQFLFCFEYYLRNRVIEHKEKKVSVKVEESESDSDEELDWEGLDDEEEEEMGVATELVPSALSGFMSRLFYLEPNNLYLVSLLRSGALARLCKKHQGNEEELCAALMEVVAHLWGVIPVSQLQHFPAAKNELISVTLPPLKGKFQELMDEHNAMAMDIFTAYVHFCARKKGADQDVEKLVSLPGSSASLFADNVEGEEGVLEGLMVKSQTRSPFAMLSGHGDVYERAEDFVTSVRPGFEVDSSLMPTMNDEIGDRKLSAYALDFFRNGRVDILEKHCKISRSNAYALLKEFSSSLLGVSLALERRANMEDSRQAERKLIADSFKLLNNSFEVKFKKAYEKW